MAVVSLWVHAFAALLFGMLALWAWRSRDMGFPRRALATALGATALWALAVSGIGAGEFATFFAKTLRDLAWLGFLITLQRRDRSDRPSIALVTVYGVIALVTIGALLLDLIAVANGGEAAARIQSAALLLRMLVSVATLLLIQSFWSSRPPAAGLRWIVLALAASWFADLAAYSVAYTTGAWSPSPVMLRGLVYILAALAMGVGLQRKGEWNVQVSRAVTYQSLSLVAIGAYFALLALATSAIATIGGSNARILQTAFVFGSTTAILTLVSNSWLRAWVKVKLAKHFFRHRYDYRSEWMRFTETLGAPDGTHPLEERIVKAIADLTESPGGVLLVPDGEALGPGESWNWDRATLPAASDIGLAAHLRETGRIIELDAVRADRGDADAGAVPRWMLDLNEAWVLVPLPHMGGLAGAILLARPTLDRALDWEDFDLLRIAGRQVASHLAEARAHDALAEAQRFDEFNRRFAFILHDIKNLVSQLTLTARNAEKHADKPEFRADMVATLQDSAERMNVLLARLSQIHRSRSEAPQATEIAPLVERVAAARRAQHPVIVAAAPAVLAICDAAGVEQILSHLVQNAIEASPADAPVTLTVATQDNKVTIDVEDHGPGMSPTFIRDQLFKPFVSSKPGGFGIGAFEAQQLARAMDGHIEVTSREGEGSRFRVVLKAALVGDVSIGRAA
jgi:putative PEP-CTERM system histidine kinase